MKKHTRVYLDEMGYDPEEFIPCEVCLSRAVDIHHIDARGMGGDPTGGKDRIENLMALCRKCHDLYGDIQDLKESLRKLHYSFVKHRGTKN